MRARGGGGLMDLDASLHTVDRATLTPLVRRTLGSEDAEVERWEHRTLYGGMGAVISRSALFRFAGTTRDGERLRPWSLVLKVLARPAAGDTGPAVADLAGWDRELLTYRSGLLDALPAGLTAPRCFAAEERPEAVWLWLEDVAEAVGDRWPVGRFALAARHLGRFNGAYLAGRPLPVAPWLGRGLLRWRADRNAAFWAGFPDVRDASLARHAWPDDLGDRALRVWGERHPLLDVLDRLPQTLGHLDASRRNLFARRTAAGEDETVAIDWAFTGVGALGEEVAPLVAGSVLWSQGVGLDDLPALAAGCLAGYAAGLADAGWRGDPRLPGIGFAIATALRFGPLLGTVGLARLTPEQRASFERAMGGTVEDLAARWAGLQRFAFDQLDAARPSLADV